MKKRIAICCDGTWAGLDSQYPTNPVRLAKAILPADPRDGTVQITFHLDGVGTGRGTGTIARVTDRLLGGLFGSGLTETVAEAYRHLVFTYRPGDEIFLFGFSRGAFTARSLAGMIRNCGILARAHAGRIRDALALYRSEAPEDHPEGERALEFRATYSPDVLTSDSERDWRERARPGRDWSRAVPLRIAYVGVWDTVGSLGVPAQWSISGILNRRHRFHDTCLSSYVRAARHAVAIDERRRNFLPTLWDNVDELNGLGLAVPDAPYQQRWFPGVHAAVGGGRPDTGLASGALLWVMEGAERQGLAFDPSERAAFVAEADPLAPLTARDGPGSLGLRDLLRLMPVDREGPDRPRFIASETCRRWTVDPDYRPRPLRRVADWLDSQSGDSQADDLIA